MFNGDIIDYVSIEIPIKELIELDEEDFLLKVSNILQEINGLDWEFASFDDITSLSILVDDVSHCKQKVILKVRGDLYNTETEETYRLRNGRLLRVFE